MRHLRGSSNYSKYSIKLPTKLSSTINYELEANILIFIMKIKGK